MPSRLLSGALAASCVLTGTLTARAEPATSSPPSVVEPAAPASAAASPPQSEPASGTLHYTLPNGLEVVLERDPSVPRVAVTVAYDVGSRDDPPGYRGLAHMVEHLMFEGMAKAVGSGYFDVVERAGATIVNGITSADRTFYVQELPASALEVGLWLEATRMAYLLSWLDAVTLERARAAVLHEWDERVGSGGLRGMLAIEAPVLYGEGHPYARVNDEPEDVEAIELGHVQWFFQQWYGPSNARLVVVGDFDVERARASIDALFSPIRDSVPRPSRSRPTPTRLTAEHELEVSRPFDRVACSVAWPAPPAHESDTYALTVLDWVLTRRLLRRTVDDEAVRHVWSSFDTAELGSEFRVFWVLDDDEHIERVQKLVDDELAAIRRGELAPELITRAIQGLRRSILFAREDVVSRASFLATLSRGRELEPFTALAEHYAAVTAQDLKRVATDWLLPDERVLMCSRHKEGAPAWGKLRRHRVREGGRR